MRYFLVMPVSVQNLITNKIYLIRERMNFTVIDICNRYQISRKSCLKNQSLLNIIYINNEKIQKLLLLTILLVINFIIYISRDVPKIIKNIPLVKQKLEELLNYNYRLIV